MFEDFIHHHLELVKKLNEKIKENDGPIFLFGAHIFSQYLLSFGLDTSRVLCILDNSPLKQGQRLYGTDLKVHSPSILESYEKPTVILKAGLYNEEIKQDIVQNINKDVSFI
jgi:hypothetical protein